MSKSPEERDEEKPEETSSRVRRGLWLVFLVVLIAGLAVAGWYYWRSLRRESTDNAFIEGTIVQVSPQVAGQVLRVYIEENQAIEQGDLLVDLDSRPYEIVLDSKRAAQRLAEARLSAAQIAAGMTETTTGAGLGQAEAVLEAAQRNAEQARAAVAAAQAESKRTQADVVRYERLEETAVSRQLKEQADAAARVAAARLQEAQEQQAAAEARVVAAQNQVEAAKTAPQQVQVSRLQVRQRAAELAQAQAAVRDAELNLSYTRIYTPTSGSVARKNVDEGEFVTVGQVLLAITSRDLWVVANFKETQLTHMQPGQSVKIEVDAYPKADFKGYIDSVQPGTGARFSLLPPENATGNYVKVVQRVPVKIRFSEPPEPKYDLVPGMSVVPTVSISVKSALPGKAQAK